MCPIVFFGRLVVCYQRLAETTLPTIVVQVNFVGRDDGGVHSNFIGKPRGAHAFTKAIDGKLVGVVAVDVV